MAVSGSRRQNCVQRLFSRVKLEQYERSKTSFTKLSAGMPAWHFLCQIPEIWHFLKWFGTENFVWHIRHSLAYFWHFL